jgi:hypothetical protein
LAAKRSKKNIQSTSKDNLVQFQERFFQKRGIKPSIDDVIGLGNSIKKFSIRVHKLYNWTEKRKVTYFLRWKLNTFGYQRELIKQVNSQLEQKMTKKYIKAKKCKILAPQIDSNLFSDDYFEGKIHQT